MHRTSKHPAASLAKQPAHLGVSAAVLALPGEATGYRITVAKKDTCAPLFQGYAYFKISKSP